MTYINLSIFNNENETYSNWIWGDLCRRRFMMVLRLCLLEMYFIMTV